MFTDQLQGIINNLTASLTEAAKLDKGNKAAGTRLRKAALEGRAALLKLREDVLDAEKAETES